MLIAKIVSGGQTGADRGALEAALEHGLDYGGWLPKGRKCEDGPLDAKFDRMTEMKSADYLKRTERNVVDSDATVVFCHGEPSGGTKRTVGFCEKHSKPYWVFDLDRRDPDAPPAVDLDDELEYLCWRCRKDSIVLNVAGPRESKCPGIQAEVKSLLLRFLRLEAMSGKDRKPTEMTWLAEREKREANAKNEGVKR